MSDEIKTLSEHERADINNALTVLKIFLDWPSLASLEPQAAEDARAAYQRVEDAFAKMAPAKRQPRLTQLQQLQAFTANLSAEKTHRYAMELGTILAAAQNRPPQGISDGSVSPATFTLYRDVEFALVALARAIANTQP